MALKKSMPLLLMMFTVMFALPLAAGAAVVTPSAFAQEEDENLASDTVSNVLDNGNTAGDNTNTQLSVPLIDQDQTDANLGLSEALDVIEEEPPITPTPPQEEEPPEFAVFCIEGTIFGTACFDTLEECEDAAGIGIIGGGECEGFESPPPGSRDCEVLRDPEGEPFGVVCAL
jgi:hypothetical protein